MDLLELKTFLIIIWTCEKLTPNKHTVKYTIDINKKKSRIFVCSQRNYMKYQK